MLILHYYVIEITKQLLMLARRLSYCTVKITLIKNIYNDKINMNQTKSSIQNQVYSFTNNTGLFHKILFIMYGEYTSSNII